MARRQSRLWLHAHRRDAFVRRAQAEGYRSRAAYKLAQIDARHRLLRAGMTVLDLGAAPGSWSQYARERLGTGGRVLAVDVLAMAELAAVEFIHGDITEPPVLDLLRARLGDTRVDLVISDMSPNITGDAVVDQARAVSLATRALELAQVLLKPGGDLLVKAFQGAEFAAFRQSMQQHFAELRSCKPEASRGRSREIYLLGRGFGRGPERSVVRREGS